jgi:hypothetical protein
MKKVILFTGLILCFFSCKKENNSDTLKVETSAYLPMTIGSYWVYKQYFIDPSGNEIQSSRYDSIIISKDTLIGDNIYFKYDNYECSSVSNVIYNNFISSSYCRDSSKNLINSKGQKLFSENNFTDTLLRKTEIYLGDTTYRISYKMERIINNVNIPAGIFSSILNFKGTVICNPKFTLIKNPRYVDQLYTKDVGMILHSYVYVTDGGSMEQRLIRYWINK